jgi:hypothetical protein
MHGDGLNVEPRRGMACHPLNSDSQWTSLSGAWCDIAHTHGSSLQYCRMRGAHLAGDRHLACAISIQNDGSCGNASLRKSQAVQERSGPSYGHLAPLSVVLRGCPCQSHLLAGCARNKLPFKTKQPMPHVIPPLHICCIKLCSRQCHEQPQHLSVRELPDPSD